MSTFNFKYFSIFQKNAAMKVGTDAMVLGALVESKGKVRMLDVGAGTGVLGLMLAQNNDSLNVDAVELDTLSANECKQNFEDSPWSDRLSVIRKDFLDFQSEERYDLIVSNPPYFQTRLKNDEVRKAQARHEDALPVNRFFNKVRELLTNNGSCWVIVPTVDEVSWLENANENNLFSQKCIQILGKRGMAPIRTVFCFSREKNDEKSDTFVIRESNGSYSEEYIELTKEFHGKSLK
jgi:tRNA1Val (adenine37-N6)-methyltransferase